MTAAQVVVVIGGSLVLLTAMIAVMIRFNRSEQRAMQRRRQEWIARGSIPEEEPTFDLGGGGIVGGAPGLGG